MSKKVNKSIGISADTEKLLLLQVIERKGVHYKLHCEQILEKASKMTSEEVNEWLKPPSKQKRKDVDQDIVSQIEPSEVLLGIAEISPDNGLFDKTGVFKGVKDNPKIYTNKKCFEFRNFITGEGVNKSYYHTLEKAQEAKKLAE
jgi:hypothetical protein